jgi:hypothetical protein
MEWLDTFKKQNQLSMVVAGFLFFSAIACSIYAASGTKYDVIEYCFKPQKVNSKRAYCTDDLKFIAPKGFFQQEKYTPSNPRFQRGIYLLSDKLTRLREIPATNRYAMNYSAIALVSSICGTFILSARAKRYTYEFSAFYAQLQADLHYEITASEQKRELRSHSINTETAYIKDTITLRDEMQRYLDKTPSQKEFEEEQAQKNNELAELQRQLQIAQFKAEIAKYQAQEAAHSKNTEKKPEINTIEPEKIDYAALCPGKVGELDYYDWRDLVDDAVGIILAGNSGSGKTSVAVWVAGWLTKDNPAEVIALDPHGNVNVLWEELGIHCIKEFATIEKQLELLVGLLDKRRMMDKVILDQQPQIIVFADEINACLENFANPDSMAIAIKRLGSEARKYNIALIALNQSSNCDDLGISAPMRANYLIILLNASARQYAANNWKKEDPRRQKVEELAYSCVVTGSVGEAIAVHPTHHSYKQFKKKGNKPQGLLPINQLPLTIELAENVEPEKDWYEEFIDLKKQLGRTPNTEEIKATWHKTMGAECSSKQAETIHEYLLNLP